MVVLLVGLFFQGYYTTVSNKSQDKTSFKFTIKEGSALKRTVILPREWRYIVLTK
jgi:hypothetical protein